MAAAAAEAAGIAGAGVAEAVDELGGAADGGAADGAVGAEPEPGDANVGVVAHTEPAPEAAIAAAAAGEAGADIEENGATLRSSTVGVEVPVAGGHTNRTQPKPSRVAARTCAGVAARAGRGDHRSAGAGNWRMVKAEGVGACGKARAHKARLTVIAVAAVAAAGSHSRSSWAGCRHIARLTPSLSAFGIY